MGRNDGMQAAHPMFVSNIETVMQFIAIPGFAIRDNDRAHCEHDAIQHSYIRDLCHTSPCRVVVATERAADEPLLFCPKCLISNPVKTCQET